MIVLILACLWGFFMPDLAPPAITSRLIQWTPVGGTSANDSLRQVNQVTRINAAAGETWADLMDKPIVTVPRALGLTRFLYHNPYGASPTLTKRYTPGGVLVDGVMHFHQYAQAVAAGLTWLSTGLDTAFAEHQALGEDANAYVGRPMPKDDTTGSPWLWPTSVSEQAGEAGLTNMASLTYWRAQLDQILAGGAGGICFDATGLDRTADTAYTLFPMLATAGTYNAGAGFTGSFTNGYDRRVYLEAAPRLAEASWAVDTYSYIALYGTMDASIGDADYMQPEDCAYPAIRLYSPAAISAAGDTEAEAYADCLAWLNAGGTAAINCHAFAADGFDIEALLDAAAGASGSSAVVAMRPTRNWRGM